ncbi:hypothetical protein ACQKOE_13845 [Novosphingobium sp. NPDC080210]|uniref:hypothetical protein n=1 Tax=Novosphingobium sp. NPDC080210 TaxID=3390596 RepID=UPI003D07F41B
MTSYTLGIGGEVPVVQWVRPGQPGEWEVFCNTPAGYDVYAVGPNGERLVDSGDAPTHKTISPTLRDGETALVIRAR